MVGINYLRFKQLYFVDFIYYFFFSQCINIHCHADGLFLITIYILLYVFQGFYIYIHVDKNMKI